MSVCENKDAFQPLVVYTNANKTVVNMKYYRDLFIVSKKERKKVK